MDVIKSNVSLEATPSSDTHIVNKSYVDSKQKTISWTEYQALSEEEKNNGTLYDIPDMPTGGTDDFLTGSDIATVLDDTVTNKQVVGAKDFYNHASTRNIKTYTSLEQLGLTAPVTTGELFNAIPNDSVCRIQATTIENTVIVSDVPYMYGILLIDKTNSDRFDIGFKKCHGGLIAGDEKWIGQLKGSDGTGLTWNRICTTSVPDVAKTNMSSKLINATIPYGGVYYSVKNGICNVQITGLVVSTSTDRTVIFPNGSLPKIDVNNTNGHYPVTSTNATCGLLVFDTDGTVKYYGNSMTIYATISYPVAEDWRP